MKFQRPKRRPGPGSFACNQVLHTPELLERIVDHLSKWEVDKLCLLEKSLVPTLFSIRYRKIRWHVYQKADRSTVRHKAASELKEQHYGAIKCNSVHVVDATQDIWAQPRFHVPPEMHKFDQYLIDNILEKCPNVIDIYCGKRELRPIDRRHFRIDKITRKRSATILLRHELDADKEFAPREREGLPYIPPEEIYDWPGWAINIQLELRLYSTSRISDNDMTARLLKRLIYKLSTDQRIIAFEYTHKISLLQLQEVLETEGCPLREFIGHCVVPFDLAEFEAFGRKVGYKLERLDLTLALSAPVQLRKHPISLLELPEFVRIIREWFPNLHTLRFPMSGYQPGVPDQYILEESVPISNLPYPTKCGRLKQIAILLEPSLRDERTDSAFFAVAKNLACLGGFDTTFILGAVGRARGRESILDDVDEIEPLDEFGEEEVIHVKENPPVIMDELVKYLKSLTVDQQDQLKSANISKLDISRYRPLELLDLTFDSDGCPIPLNTTQAKKALQACCEMHLSVQKLLEKNFEEASDLKESIEDWVDLLKKRNIPHQVPKWPFKRDLEGAQEQLETAKAELKVQEGRLHRLQEESRILEAELDGKVVAEDAMYEQRMAMVYESQELEEELARVNSEMP